MPTLQPHQQRVVVEKAELDLKLNALNEFTGTETFQDLPSEDRWLLDQQYQAMSAYSAVLARRIARFE